MLESITFTIHEAIQDLPVTWNTIAKDNAFLQTSYLSVLGESSPVNMQCFYIAIYENNKHIGVVLAQYIQSQQLSSFGDRDKCFRIYTRNFLLRHFASNVLFIGNNMITGQNGYAFNKEMNFSCISQILQECKNHVILHLKKQNINIHIIVFKDFYEGSSNELKKYFFKDFFEFNIQPNMIFELNPEWKTEEDYMAALSKKYRDQYKRSHKKFSGITTRELSLEEIKIYEERIYELYHHVAKNAPFNTFFLSKHHFYTFKKQCGNGFKLTGYFLNDDLIGFHTLLLNGELLETYFLGYDEYVQKEKMLYLNMLYNMTEFGIKNQFKKIIFGRTALEIKSSIGAKPVVMSGFIYHRNAIINRFINKIFARLEPQISWQERHPFK
ncbi:8-amino-7-oxononanoate synthase [Flavobacterium covae]|uniref:8-amino-7-oxononanoate synthase n=1 Tax=Flavobacterium columnare TaxID=996 RepID=A0AA94F3R6_9FLAO|nr:8-amino-7-oxononanoate synthase [Flavobacterium covae]OXA83612.1 8-amino-7-oxononanoate synthase [Flavobacterium columnare NBRC 100251 = ATCC 23463]POR23332.1 8-amino-7-oxononanoate synthase [Flavobacterium columnare]AND64474.1 8-amino-7-oxononanoate synthase [Flavobacterium covae]OWP81990.1 8-amino-7-oxononanoate synthase [Flavobacterium covae]